jgi:hypothetical protein
MIGHAIQQLNTHSEYHNVYGSNGPISRVEPGERFQRSFITLMSPNGPILRPRRTQQKISSTNYYDFASENALQHYRYWCEIISTLGGVKIVKKVNALLSHFGNPTNSSSIVVVV